MLTACKRSWQSRAARDGSRVMAVAPATLPAQPREASELLARGVCAEAPEGRKSVNGDGL